MIPSAVPFPVSNRLFCPPPRSDTAPPPAASAQTSPPEISALPESRICSAVFAPRPRLPLNSSRHLRCPCLSLHRSWPRLDVRSQVVHHTLDSRVDPDRVGVALEMSSDCVRRRLAKSPAGQDTTTSYNYEFVVQ